MVATHMAPSITSSSKSQDRAADGDGWVMSDSSFGERSDQTTEMTPTP